MANVLETSSADAPEVAPCEALAGFRSERTSLVEAVLSPRTGDAPLPFERAFVVIDPFDRHRSRQLPTEELSRLLRGRVRVGVHVSLHGGSLAETLRRSLVSRLRVARAGNLLRSAGATSIHVLAIYPSLEHPTLVYQMEKPARRYAEENVIATAHEQPIYRRVMRTMVSWLAGVDIAAASLVVTGELE